MPGSEGRRVRCCRPSIRTFSSVFRGPSRVIGEALTINAVKTAVLRIPLAQPVGDSQNMVDSWWLTVAMVETACGIIGWGYNSGISPALKAVKTLIDVAIAPELVGRDAFNVRELWNRTYYDSHFTGESGVSFQGVAAVEIAMWDAVAKCLCQPLCRLLGNSGPPKFPALQHRCRLALAILRPTR